MSKRRRAQRSNFSASYLVGYTEDEESVEAIMKKFDELDTLKNQQQEELTQDQLEELFKRTSVFTLHSTEKNSLDLNHLDDDDYLHELLHQSEDEKDDYQIADDDFWAQEFASLTTNNNQTTTRKRTPRNPAESQRANIINKYKLQQVQMQDKSGNSFIIKKRVATVDPSLPTYIKIPAAPIPRSWVKQIKPLNLVNPVSVTNSRYFETSNIFTPSLYRQLGSKFQVIYMNPPLLLPDESPTPGKISLQQFAQIPIPSLITIPGFLFIWTPKQLIPNLLTQARAWGFKYVENFCWIHKDTDNRIRKGESRYFRKSKDTCLIFRSLEGEVDIRHQRSPDCEFDYTRPEFLYDVIETLLPGACYDVEKDGSTGGGERMLELWAGKDRMRKGWSSVYCRG